MKTTPSLGLNVNIAGRAAKLAAQSGAKPMAFSIPPQATMPCIGDKFTILLAGVPTTLKVVDREFE